MADVIIDSFDNVLAEFRKFLRDAPLYRPYVFSMPGAKGVPTPISCDMSSVGTIMLFCEKPCGRDTTWIRENHSFVAPIQTISFKCGLCLEKMTYYYVYGTPDRTRIWKIGQYPPQSVSLPDDLGSVLKDEADLYKKALISRNQAYGLGALAYIRRVVENKVDSILENLIELAKNEGRTDDVDGLERIRESKVAADKLREAAKYLPTILRPGDQNPLALLHNNYSVGIHRLTEDECLDVFDQTRFHFEYILSNLQKLLLSGTEYVKGLQRITEKTKKKT